MTPCWKCVAAALALATASHSGRAEGDKGFSAGVEAHSRTSLKDLGLRGYPGAQPRVDAEQGDNKAAVSLGLWGGPFGLRVQVMKFSTSDAPSQVAAFYLKALSADGPVLDCQRPETHVKPSKEEPGQLTCEDDQPVPGGFVYRAGTAKHFRVVSVKPDGAGTRFDLVRIAIGN